MLDTEEIQWVKSTANELNNLLQVISESSQVLEMIQTPTPDSEKYFAILRSGIERAASVTKVMVARVGGYSAEPTASPTPARAPAAPAPVFKAVIDGATDVKIANPNGPRELVLLVDDEELVTVLAQRVLTDEGYRVATARDGFKAIEIYRKLRDQISLIILDFTMPVMDGADVFEELREINPQVPVVLSSGFAEQDRLRAMLAKGLRGFIPKPYTQDKLLAQIRATLDAMQMEKASRRVA